MENTKSEASSKTEDTPKKAKRPSIIRWGAIGPLTVVAALTFLYFHFLFDLHFRKSIEWLGYTVVGAEVNVSKVETSFWKASLKISDLEITNAEKPTHNLVSLGEIKFSMVWDALLRGKVVIHEAAIEQIMYDNSRKTPGRVKPPEPESSEEKPSLLETEAKKLSNEALDKVQDEYGDNVLGDVAALLGGASGDSKAKELEGQLQSKVKIAELQKSFNESKNTWNTKIAELPQAKDFKAIGDKLSKVKTKDFKTPEELKSSLDQIQNLLKEGDSLGQKLQTTSKELESNLKKLNADMKDLEKFIQSDIKMLQAHFKIPQLDGAAISKSLLKKYIDPYMAQFNKYNKLARKYIPPGLLEKKKDDKPDMSIQPHPRAKGVVYEFGRQNSYPLFWLQRAAISSKANAEHPEVGNLIGEALDLTSNGFLTGKPMILKFSGDFPGLFINDIMASLTLNHHRFPFNQTLRAKIGSYVVDKKTLASSKDIELGFNKATGSSLLEATFMGKNWNFSVDNAYTQIEYNVSSPNKIMDEILKKVFQEIPILKIQASGEGEFPKLPINIKSNLGSELAASLSKILNTKIEEAKAQVKKIVDESINKEKQKLDDQLSKLKGQVDAEVKKASEQVAKQKAEIDSKTQQAKKDFEDRANKAKKEAEAKATQQLQEEAKKKLGPDANKKLDDLKKKIKF
jgi:uncharacterized protein (TIGR03545 family)